MFLLVKERKPRNESHNTQVSVESQILTDTVLDDSFLPNHAQTTLNSLYWSDTRAILAEKEKDIDRGGARQQNGTSLEPSDKSEWDRLETRQQQVWEDEGEVAAAEEVSVLTKAEQQFQSLEQHPIFS